MYAPLLRTASFLISLPLNPRLLFPCRASFLSQSSSSSFFALEDTANCMVMVLNFCRRVMLLLREKGISETGTHIRHMKRGFEANGWGHMRRWDIVLSFMKERIPTYLHTDTFFLRRSQASHAYRLLLIICSWSFSLVILKLSAHSLLHFSQEKTPVKGVRDITCNPAKSSTRVQCEPTCVYG